MQEQWKHFDTTKTGGRNAIATRERYWWISDYGRVKITNNYNDSVKWPKVSLTGGHEGRRYAALSPNYLLNKYIHKLVAIMYCHNPFGETTGRRVTVDHVDGNKTNNHYTNLEWVTAKENAQRFHLRKNEPNWNAGEQSIIQPDMTREEVDAYIVDLHINGMKRREIQKRLSVTQGRVARPIRQYKETRGNYAI
jgi:hypothetical protein